MGYDANLERRILDILSSHREISSKKMFCGVCFLYRGNMLYGIDGENRLMLRVGPEQHEHVLSLEHARKMDFTGKSMLGYVFVDQKGFATKKALEKWLTFALTFTSKLPKKIK